MSKHLADAIVVWCSSYPRRVTAHQKWANNPLEVGQQIKNADDGISPFVSVYSFPNGHTKKGNVPSIDCIFFDFDIPRGGEYRSANPDPQAWYRDMSGLLTRVRAVCRMLIEDGYAQYFRAALSGHKGVHLYLDFPPIDADEGSQGQFKQGMRRYSDEFIEFLEQSTHLDLEAWVDVDSSDLARLCRLPNTKHGGASEAFNEDRYCVPVSIRELANITPHEYSKLTRSTRSIPDECRRVQSENAASTITQYIREATSSGGSRGGASEYDPRALKNYEKNENENITIDDIEFLTARRPNIWAFRSRDDAFDYGASSHAMECHVIASLAQHNVPIDVIVEFFSVIPGFNEQMTRDRIEKVISHKLNPYRNDTLRDQAPMFSLEQPAR